LVTLLVGSSLSASIWYSVFQVNPIWFVCLYFKIDDRF